MLKSKRTISLKVYDKMQCFGLVIEHECEGDIGLLPLFCTNNSNMFLF